LIAFDSPNYPPLAEAGVKIIFQQDLLLKAGGSLRISPFRPQKIAVLKIFPGIQFDFLKIF